MVPAGSKAEQLSSVNHTTKTIHRHQLRTHTAKYTGHWYIAFIDNFQHLSPEIPCRKNFLNVNKIVSKTVYVNIVVISFFLTEGKVFSLDWVGSRFLNIGLINAAITIILAKIQEMNPRRVPIKIHERQGFITFFC